LRQIRLQPIARKASGLSETRATGLGPATSKCDDEQSEDAEHGWRVFFDVIAERLASS
jgi:hypothetical protein